MGGRARVASGQVRSSQGNLAVVLFQAFFLGASVPQLSAAAVTVDGRQLLVDGQPINLKGVNWNPVPIGKKQKHAGVNFRGFVSADSELMAAAGVNAVRTYEPITDKDVLDVLWRRGIYVLNTVYIKGNAEVSSVVETVKSLRDHPAILMWVIGNEWNYNMLYSEMDLDEALTRVNVVARLVKDLDANHPVATVYGMLPGPQQLTALDAIDVWGMNVYTGLSFGEVFEQWATLTGKPLFIAEFGADAFNEIAGRVDEASQAKATTMLTEEIITHGTSSDGVCMGGFIFEFADEWWKDDAGSPFTHDIGGIAPGGGPYPDSTFNEEYWGIVKIDGTPRQAYHAYAAVDVPRADRPGNYQPKLASADIPASYRQRACGATPRCSFLFGDCCPGEDGDFHECCGGSGFSSIPPGGPKTTSTSAAAAPATTGEPATPPPEPRQPQCVLGDSVPCCPHSHGNCGNCSGNQCCPSHYGAVTCPSASQALADGCTKPKLYDCTGLTGIEAPATTTSTLTTTAPRSLPATTTTLSSLTNRRTRTTFPAIHTTPKLLTEAGTTSPSRSHSAVEVQTTTRIHRAHSEHGTLPPILPAGPPTSPHTSPPATPPTIPPTVPPTVPPTLPPLSPAASSTTAVSVQPRPDASVAPPAVSSTSSAATTTAALTFEGVLDRLSGVHSVVVDVHTTLPPPAQAGAWVLAAVGASCAEACLDAGGCLESAWPTGASELMKVVTTVGYACDTVADYPGGGQDGGAPYNPSTRHHHCSWKYRRSPGATFRTRRCSLAAPAFTQRFCPCRVKPAAEANAENAIMMRKRLLSD